MVSGLFHLFRFEKKSIITGNEYTPLEAMSYRKSNELVSAKYKSALLENHQIGGLPNLGDTHRISDHIGLTSNTYNGYSLIRLKKGL